MAFKVRFLDVLAGFVVGVAVSFFCKIPQVDYYAQMLLDIPSDATGFWSGEIKRGEIVVPVGLHLMVVEGKVTGRMNQGEARLVFSENKESEISGTIVGHTFTGEKIFLNESKTVKLVGKFGVKMDTFEGELFDGNKFGGIYLQKQRNLGN